ncbi:MAG TPA: ribonuclease HII [bacterium]|nr:ribonuclease HII [bacterium]HPG36608.1 ribonuclease HII [bacterium]HRQ69546.1 ribonuclease HII [bacterium]
MNGLIGEIDRNYQIKGFSVIGVDEAGRGPLCGPVVTAAVCLFCDIEGLNDSKKLSEKKRLELLPQIIKNSVWAVYSVSPKIIDELNILHATMFGMAKCIERVKRKVEGKQIVLIDGNRVTGKFDLEEAVVKGDSKSVNIAAASILAKTQRDRIMNRLALIYPEYKLDLHKGYPTSEHYEILEKIGPCEIYRKSFKLKADIHHEQMKLF